MRKSKKQPITQYKYYGNKDYTYELSLAREYSDADAIAKIVLYRIDIVKSKSHSLYGESRLKDKRFLEPIELNVTTNIDDITGGLYNESIGIFKFGVYIQELEEKGNIEIKRGDYYKYFDGDKERVFEVTKSSNINTANSQIGYKPIYIIVEGQYLRDRNIEDLI